MRRHHLIEIVLMAILVASCSTTKFTPDRGEVAFEGTGGTVREVEGIDFWERGEPDREYQIIGSIEDSRGEGLVSGSGKDADIARVARENGGDAVILSGGRREFRRVDVLTGASYYQRFSTLVVVKYLE